MDGVYVILGGLIILAIWAFVISYKEDHPQKRQIDTFFIDSCSKFCLHNVIIMGTPPY